MSKSEEQKKAEIELITKARIFVDTMLGDHIDKPSDQVDWPAIALQTGMLLGQYVLYVEERGLTQAFIDWNLKKYGNK